MNQANWQVPTFFNSPAVVNNGEALARDMFRSPVRITHSFSNNLNVPVAIVQRSGLRFELKPEPYPMANVLVIRTEILITGEGSLSVGRFLSAIGEHSSAELQAMKKAFQTQVEQAGNNGVRIVLDYPVEYETLSHHGGTVYYSELDMVVSLSSLENVCEHPYSQAGRDVANANSLPLAVDGLDFNYAISVVDNSGTRGAYWLNINGRVSKVTPKRDGTRKDGIHLVSNFSLGGDQPTRLVSEYYTFDSAEELGLYKSHDEAMCLGDLQGQSKAEVLKLEQKIVSMKQERELALLEQKKQMDTVINQIEREKLDLDKQKREAEERAETRRQEMKDMYEARSYGRKDNSEALKLLPNIIIGIGAVFLAISTFAKGSSKSTSLLDW